MSKITDQIKAEPAKDVKEQLTFLVNAAKGKLNEQQEKIERAFLNPEAEGKIRVIPDTQIKWYSEYRCNASEDAKETAGVVGSVIDSFFSGNFKDGIKSLVTNGLSSIMGSASTGETQENMYFVTFEHNVIIRVDVSVWKYNFSSKSIIANVQNAFCYTFCKSVVDHTKVRKDTLLYYFSQHVNDDPVALEKYIKELNRLWKLLDGKDPENLLESVSPKLNAKYDSYERLLKLEEKNYLTN